MAFCTNCGTAVADGTSFCSKCGAAVGATVSPGGAATATSGGLSENVAGLLAYVTIIPAIVFLVLPPYNRNRFIRFHAFQCIFLAIAWFVINIVLFALPFGIGFMARSLVGLAGLVLWIWLMIKAHNGEKWKLPVIGDMAEKQANTL